MTGLSVNLRGFNQLQQRLARLSKEEATKAGQIANRAGATAYAKEARKIAPASSKTTEGEVRTRHNKGGTTRTEVHGKLRNHIKVRKTKSTSVTQVHNAIGLDGFAYHGTFVEFGSIHNSANPFMFRALTSNQQTIIDAIAKSLQKQLIKRGV